MHAYPPAALAGDYLRAAAGFVPAAAVLALTPLGTAAAIVLAGLAALFGVFGLRTALRHLTSIERTEQGLVARGPLPRSIDWGALDHMRLAFYATARDRKSGWMQLELRSGSARLNLDSRIDGFAELVACAAGAARRRGLRLNEATLTNLAALGLETGAAATARVRP